MISLIKNAPRWLTRGQMQIKTKQIKPQTEKLAEANSVPNF